MTITKKNLRTYAYIFLSVLFVAIFFMVPSASASVGDKIADFPGAMLETINTGVINVIRTQLTEGPFYDLIVGTDGNGTSTMIKTFMNAIYPIAFTMVFISCAYKYSKKLETGADPQEAFFQTLIQVCLICVAALNVSSILALVARGGTTIIAMALDAVGTATTPTGDVITLDMITSSTGVLGWVQGVMTLLIPWIITLLMTIFAKFLSYSLLIELGVRRALSPIFIAQMTDGEGLRSPGVRSLKRYLATFVKIAICLIVCGLGQELLAVVLTELQSVTNWKDSLSGILNYMFSVIAINFTILGVLPKTGEYANDFIGV